MPETYITVPGEKGGVYISEDVIAGIAGAAIADVDGVAGLTHAACQETGERFGRKGAPRGVSVDYDGSAVQIDAAILVRYGESIAAIGERAQAAAAAAVESMTGLPSVVNILVAGVSFEK